MKFKFLNHAFTGVIFVAMAFTNVANAGLIETKEFIDLGKSEGQARKSQDTIGFQGAGILKEIELNYEFSYLYLFDNSGGVEQDLDVTFVAFDTNTLIVKELFNIKQLVEPGQNVTGNRNVSRSITISDSDSLDKWADGNRFMMQISGGNNDFAVANTREISANLGVTYRAEVQDLSRAIPEPSTIAIFSLGVFGLVARRFAS